MRKRKPPSRHRRIRTEGRRRAIPRYICLDFLGGAERDAPAITQSFHKLAIVDGAAPEGAARHGHVVPFQERFYLAQQIISAHADQDVGLLPICQWAIAQMTYGQELGKIPPMETMGSGWRPRLRDAMAVKDTNMKRLSVAAGLGETYVRDILERGRDPSIENAQRLATQLGVPYSAIFGRDGGQLAAPPAKAGIVEVGGKEFARLPVYDIRFAAGAGSENYDEAPIDHYLINISVLRAMTTAPLHMIAGFQSAGDSMAPTINDLDWCFADLGRTRLYNPGIYALVFEGEGLLKRAAQHLETGAVTLISDNSTYAPQLIKKPDRLHVVGRVFMSIRRHG